MVTLLPAPQPPEQSSERLVVVLIRIPRAEKRAGRDPPVRAGGLTEPERGRSREASCSHQAHVWTLNILLLGWLSEEDERPRARVHKAPSTAGRVQTGGGFTSLLSSEQSRLSASARYSGASAASGFTAAAGLQAFGPQLLLVSQT